MTPDLDTLLQERAIVDTIVRLFIATDSRDWRAARACFADEVHFDVTSLAGGRPTQMTPQAITQAWEAGLKPIATMHHQVGNFRVEVQGEEASAFCYGTAWHYRPNPTGRNTRLFVGTYDFGLRCSADGWRIRRFKFNLKFIDGNPALESA